MQSPCRRMRASLDACKVACGRVQVEPGRAWREPGLQPTGIIDTDTQAGLCKRKHVSCEARLCIRIHRYLVWCLVLVHTTVSAPIYRPSWPFSVSHHRGWTPTGCCGQASPRLQGAPQRWRQELAVGPDAAAAGRQRAMTRLRVRLAALRVRRRRRAAGRAVPGRRWARAKEALRLRALRAWPAMWALQRVPRRAWVLMLRTCLLRAAVRAWGPRW